MNTIFCRTFTACIALLFATLLCNGGVCYATPGPCQGVTCTASDQCHDVGTCNSGTGLCTNPVKSNGTTCNDGNACTHNDACQGGVCTGNPVTCTASDQCHVDGTCDTNTGSCSNPSHTDGTTCNDGNACTQTDTCQSGICTGGNPVTCSALDQCHLAGTCDTNTGSCSNPAASNGTACVYNNVNGLCRSGVCNRPGFHQLWGQQQLWLVNCKNSTDTNY